MKKVIGIVLFVLLVGLAVVIFNRNILARFIIVNGIKKTCGLGVTIKSMSIGLPEVTISGLTVYNPPGYKDKIMADIPEISVNFDLPAFFKNQVHLGKLQLDIKELDVALNEQGKLNVNSLAVFAPKPGPGKPPEVKIDTLMIKVDKVSYSGAFPAVGAKSGEFNPGIDETFHDVTDPSKVTAEVMQKILSRIGIQNLANFDILKGKGGAGAAAQDALNKAEQGLNKLFSK